MNIIDRRLNPSGKSLANRQRFLRRARAQIMKSVREASGGRSITDIAGGERVSIPMDGLREPSFHRSAKGGTRDHVLPGNREYVEGDTIPKPERGEDGDGGPDGSPDGGGEDDFHFILSRDEFLDIFLEDLELPDLVKRNIAKSESFIPARAGWSVTGSPSNLNLVRTMRNSLSRRIALKRPKSDEMKELEARIRALEESGDDPELLSELRLLFDQMLTKSRRVPYIDPVDVRYNRFEQLPKPVTQAVMFCLMDVSGSMTEHMKDLAKRFFMLLYLFLNRRYKHVDIVFIRHTHEAKEVDEDTFFYSTETGGTVVSTALTEMKRIIRARYSPTDWNIYAAQASDGDNTSSDNATSAALLEHDLLPLAQYFAYIEVGAEYKDWLGRETDLWRTYKVVAKPGGNLAMRKVRVRSQIFPVFRELFSREGVNAIL
ncbi:MAG: YeaH/YhbH family protein [Alphaproteobacteria bacterium]|nr:YeaH/YhbH family protein [Alphaproteobacteria bacterium]